MAKSDERSTLQDQETSHQCNTRCRSGSRVSSAGPGGDSPRVVRPPRHLYCSRQLISRGHTRSHTVAGFAMLNLVDRLSGLAHIRALHQDRKAKGTVGLSLHIGVGTLGTIDANPAMRQLPIRHLYASNLRNLRGYLAWRRRCVMISAVRGYKSNGLSVGICSVCCEASAAAKLYSPT